MFLNYDYLYEVSKHINSDQISNISLLSLLEKTGANSAPSKKLAKLGKSSSCTEV